MPLVFTYLGAGKLKTQSWYQFIVKMPKDLKKKKNNPPLDS